MQKIIFIGLLISIFVKCGIAQENVLIVPYPKQVAISGGSFMLSPELKVGCKVSELADAAQLLVHDLYVLHGIKTTCQKGNSEIVLDFDTALRAEEYSVDKSKNWIS